MLIICRKPESFMEVDDSVLTQELGITHFYLEGLSFLIQCFNQWEEMINFHYIILLRIAS